MPGKEYIIEQKIFDLVGGYIFHQNSVKNNLGFCVYVCLFIFLKSNDFNLYNLFRDH